jgi:hypothetical protein
VVTRGLGARRASPSSRQLQGCLVSARKLPGVARVSIMVDMTKNQTGNMNGSFDAGAAEGSVKCLVKNTSVTVHDPNRAVRRAMSWRYGFEDGTAARRPDDGRPVRLP